ncbi:MAG: hypothetical protein ACE5J4_01370 [Candidatus Aenigmatarchaeota archaeon]
MTEKKKNLWLGMTFVLVAGLLIGYFVHSFIVPVTTVIRDFETLSLEEKRIQWLKESSNIRDSTTYRCCLENPCYYCIYKTPKHGEGASCACMDDVLAGVHPCGECIGEILEGHGLKSLAPYFAKSIAEEVGEQHLDHLKQIIEEKYGVPVEDQM